MLYPVYVHVGNATEAYGVTFPDFPGCFSAADEWADWLAAIQGGGRGPFPWRTRSRAAADSA